MMKKNNTKMILVICDDVTETQKISNVNFWTLDPFCYAGHIRIVRIFLFIYWLAGATYLQILC